MKKLLALAALLLATPALAQTVTQSGTVTRNHIPYWVTSGVIGDSGSATDSPISGIGVTNEGGAGLCVSSQRASAAGRQQLCFSASTATGGIISLQNYGTATAQGLSFVINGTPVNLPTGGGNFLVSSGVIVNGHLPCFSGTLGVVVDCGTSIGAGTAFGLPYYSTTSSLGSTGAGTSGQFLIGQGASVPLWTTLSGDVSSVSGGGVVTLGKVNGIPYSATYAANGVLIGEGTNAFHSISTLNVGQCLLSQGASDPIWSSCASGSGSAGGSNTQVQFNNATALGGSVNLTWVSPTLTIGVAGATTGQLGLASSTATGTVTLQAPGVSTSYNFNFPVAAGTSGQPMLSGGGGSTPNTFGTLNIGGGGTNCTSASGTCLDNITGFSSTGFVQRTGAGSYAFSLVVPVSGGGTSLANGTSGGILGFTGTGTIASSALLAQFGLLVGGGSGATPSSITNGTAGQLLIAQTSANPAWSTMSGDATIASSGALTIAASAVTVAKQANAAAWTLEGNFTSGSTAPQFSTIGALTQKASPAATDLLLVQDQAASGALKYATVSSIASAGSVGSVNTLTGAVTLIPVAGDARNLKIARGSATTLAVTYDQVVTATTLSGIPYTEANGSHTLTISGTGANGMDTGSAPTSGFLCVYAISKGDNATYAVLGVNAATNSCPTIYPGANMPAGYTSSGLIGIWPTNGSAQIIAGTQYGRKFYNQAPVSVFSGTGPASLTTQSVSTAVPAAAKTCDVIVGNNGVSGNNYIWSIAGDSTGTGLKEVHSSQSTFTNTAGTLPLSWSASLPDIPLLTAQTIFIQEVQTRTNDVVYVTSYTF